MKFFYFIFILIFVGCDQFIGTDTGNPIQIENPTIGIPFIGAKTARIFCEKISQCNHFPEEQEKINACSFSFYTQVDVNFYFNLPTKWRTLEAIDRSIFQKTLVEQSEKSHACLKTVRELSCQSSLINESYDPSSPQNFNNLDLLLTADPSCQEMIKERERNYE